MRISILARRMFDRQEMEVSSYMTQDQRPGFVDGGVGWGLGAWMAELYCFYSCRSGCA
jgi:hypothetical protein